MKNGTAASTYDVGDAERVVNPTEDNDLVQIGYKPELEVSRCHAHLRRGQLLTLHRDDLAYGL